MITNAEFQRLKAQSSKNEPIQKLVTLKDVGLDGLSDNVPSISIDGTDVRVSDDFLESFCNNLNINTRLLKMFNKKERATIVGKNGKKKHKTIVVEDKASKMVLIEAIKDYRTKMKGDSQVLMVADPSSKMIVDICNAKYYNRLTNRALFEMVEYIANEKHFGLDVSHVHNTKGGLTIGLLANNPIQINGLPTDETFNFGTTLISSFTKTSLMDYNMRLACTNGMLDAASREMASMGGKTITSVSAFTDKTVHRLLGAVNDLRDANYIPAGFTHNLTKCHNTQASLNEVESALNLCINHIDESDDKLKEAFEFSLKENHFPAIRSTHERIKDKVNIGLLSDEEKSYIKTPMTVWDTVNAVTYLASNDSGISFKHKDAMKKEAGKLMKGKIDFQHMDLTAI